MIRTGYDPKQIIGADELRSKIHQALVLNPHAVSEANINAYAKMSGQIRGATELLKRESKQRLETARAALNARNVLWQHAQQAAALETQYQQGEARNLQQMSGRLIDLGITQEQHSGFSSHLDIAERVMKF
jgi:hypothetical protein